jgi:hypothetical protein
MAITRAQQLKELVPGLNALFGLEYARYGDEWKPIYETENSERAFEEETKLVGFGAAPVKNEGVGITFDTAQESYTSRYTHNTVALAFAITEEAMEDNLYVSLSQRYTKALARSMAYSKNVSGASLLNNAFSGSYLGGDGVSLCGINSSSARVGHPLYSGGVNYNNPATGVDLNETSLEAAIIAIGQWTDERGLLIAAKPKGLILPINLQFVAERLLKTALRTGTADNDLNAIKSRNDIPGGSEINHYLTDTNAWFVKTDVPDGLKHFMRVPLKQTMDGDFDTGNVKYKARERYSFGWSDPLAIWGSAGSS